MFSATSWWEKRGFGSRDQLTPSCPARHSPSALPRNPSTARHIPVRSGRIQRKAGSDGKSAKTSVVVGSEQQEQEQEGPNLGKFVTGVGSVWISYTLNILIYRYTHTHTLRSPMQTPHLFFTEDDDDGGGDRWWIDRQIDRWVSGWVGGLSMLSYEVDRTERKRESYGIQWASSHLPSPLPLVVCGPLLIT